MKKSNRILALAVCVIMAFSMCIPAFAESAYIPVTDIILSDFKLSMYYGDTAKLTATVVPEHATNAEIYWISSNEALLKVDSLGNLTASKDEADTPSGPKNVTISAVCKSNTSITASCIVTIDNKPADKIKSAFENAFNLLKSALPSLFESISSSIKPLFEKLIQFVQDLFKNIAPAE